MEWVITVVLTMLLMLGIANLVVMQYTTGAVRAAAAAGARSGAALATGTGDCLATARAVLIGESGLLRGSIGRDATVDCAVEGDQITVRVTAQVPWFTGIPAPVRIVGEERRHREPEP